MRVAVTSQRTRRRRGLGLVGGQDAKGLGLGQRARAAHHRRKATRHVTAVAVTPDGKRAVSASADQTLKVWDLASGGEKLH